MAIANVYQYSKITLRNNHLILDCFRVQNVLSSDFIQVPVLEYGSLMAFVTLDPYEYQYTSSKNHRETIFGNNESFN